MTFLQLEYFHAVAELGSISRVAERYNISPAALSRSISQLERELGTELFDHEGRSIILNNDGRVFLQCTTEILDSMLTARKRISDARIQNLVRLRLDTLLDEPGELPVLFKTLRPDLLVEIIPPDRTTMRYDLRLFSTTNVIRDSRYELVCSEHFVAALPASHTWANAPSLRLSDLKNESFIIYRSVQHEQALFEMCDQVGFAPHIGMTFGSMAHHGLRRAIESGLGCSIVPELVSRTEWDPEKVSLIPLSDIERVRHIYATTVDGSPIEGNCRFIVDTIRDRLTRSR